MAVLTQSLRVSLNKNKTKKYASTVLAFLEMSPLHTVTKFCLQHIHKNTGPNTG
jgi:hypothetical protein